ncbi:MAG: late competence development ComFB family protein [Schwartzia sp.]|nr:late competence development ComFB family protein [Schwartzia sp. (in: firmicutes)]
MELRNFMEDIVSQNISSVLKEYPNCCRCDECRMDIACIALNHLPPKYVSTHQGNIYARLDGMSVSYMTRVIEEIAKAIEIVEKNPRHDASKRV